MRKSVLFIFLCVSILMFVTSSVQSQYTFYRNFGPYSSPRTYTNSCYEASNGDYVFGLSDTAVSIQRTDSNGIVIWTTRIDHIHSNYTSYVVALAGTADGGFLAAITSPNYSLYPGSILKLDGNGNFVWIKNIQFNYITVLTHAIVSSDSSFIFCGKIDEPQGIFHDPIICKVSFTGDVLWNTVFRQPGDEFISEVTEIDSGNLIVFARDVNYINGFIFKLTSGGSTQLVKTYLLNTFPRFEIENLHRGLGNKLFFSGSYRLSSSASNATRFTLGEIDSSLSIISSKSYSIYGYDANVYEQTNGEVMVILTAQLPQPPISSTFGPASMLLSSSLSPINIKISTLWACDIYLKHNIRLSDTRFLQCLSITDHFINSPMQTVYSRVRKYSSQFTECNSVNNYAVNDSVLNWPALNTISVQVDSVIATIAQGVVLGVLPFTSSGTSCTPTGIEDQISEELIIISPNPVSSVLYVSFPDGLSTSTIEIFDINGSLKRTLRFESTEQNQISINTDEFPSGVYFISIMTEGSNQPIRKKFVKLN